MPKGIEREHKYLVSASSYRGMAESHVKMEQGYLCREPGRIVRIRIAGGKGYLTVKGRNHGDTRLEYEYEIPEEDARRMLGLCPPPVLKKTRWFVPYGGFTWEVDEFESPHAGLVTAEIELPLGVDSYPVPPFVGENVTGNPDYCNSNL